MYPLLFVVAATTLGIEVGWQPLAEGGHEYTIQLEPQLLEVLKEGNDIISEVPPQLNVRRYRITIGEGKLSRVDGHATAHEAQPARDPQPLDDEPAPRWPQREKHREPDPALEEAPLWNDKPADKVEAPGQFPDPPSGAPLENRPVDFQEEPQDHRMDKPELKGDVVGAKAEPVRAWMPLLITLVLLCCSLGGNIYLGWIAWEARVRYRQALAKFRAAAA